MSKWVHNVHILVNAHSLTDQWLQFFELSGEMNRWRLKNPNTWNNDISTLIFCEWHNLLTKSILESYKTSHCIGLSILSKMAVLRLASYLEPVEPRGQGGHFSHPHTVLPNGVKVAVSDWSQKCQKLTKVGLACSLQLYWMYFI